ncbi:hypothetical protein HMPREF1544_08648 [Mucor circinelloides 1006PhL]|uniref:Uncharacterized protein n=1 Tax=Mucor circinelloides f. circinelloides (strain 1006PhL) TaxID=1220926 RepID=S2J3D8_MUCC1|nr:hypothetical protein HMPREF1544_08648 [Mucor circinelloides 1006PhL]
MRIGFSGTSSDIVINPNYAKQLASRRPVIPPCAKDAHLIYLNGIGHLSGYCTYSTRLELEAWLPMQKQDHDCCIEHFAEEKTIPVRSQQTLPLN